MKSISLVLRLLVGVAGFVGQNQRLGSFVLRSSFAWVRSFFVLHSPGFVLLRSVLLGSSSFAWFFVRLGSSSPGFVLLRSVLLGSSSFAWFFVRLGSSSFFFV
nr:hypothetical protein CFP56_77468 [Quercus suber]